MRLLSFGKPGARQGRSDAAQAGVVRETPSLVQSAFLNTLVALIEYGAVLAVSVIITPLLLSGLGSSLFGTWQILKQFVSYMGAADGRPTNTLKWLIANQQGSQDFEAKRRAVGTAVQIWAASFPILLIVGTLLVWLSPLFAHSDPEIHTLVRLTCGILALSFVFDGLLTIPAAILRGTNQGYRRAGLNALLPIIGGVLSVLAVESGLSLIGLAAAQFIVLALGGILFLRIIKRYVPWFGIAWPQRGEVKSFFIVSAWFLGWRLVNRLLIASDVLLLGYFGSAILVASYVTTSFPLQALVILLDAIVGSTTPGLGRLIGEEIYDKARRVRAEGMLYSWLVLTSMSACIAMWNQSFMDLWIGPGHFAGGIVNVLLILLSMQLVFFRNDAAIIDLTLDLKNKVILGCIAAIVSVVLAAALIPDYEIIGLCAGLLIGRGILTIAYPLLVMRKFGMRDFGDIPGFVRRAVVTIALVGIAAYVGVQYQVHTWVELFAFAGLSFGVICLAMAAVGLQTHERNQMLSRFRSIRLKFSS